MNNKTLYVCYASSDYYARETGISMLGFFDNNPDYEPDVIFILDYGILPSNKEKLNGIASDYGKRIEYLPAKSILETIQHELNLNNFRGSLATYSRAFIDKIMPEYVERLLYIDSDTVVVGSVSELKRFEMEDAVMAGCIAEVFANDIKKGKTVLYSNNDIYIGCGIVLFDLRNWREKNCYMLIESILHKKKKFPCADQTLINNSIPDKYFKRIPRKYNYPFHFFNEHIERKIMSEGDWNSHEEIEEAINHPVIIHYPGFPINRPWYEGCCSRRKDDYYKYKELSPWRETPLYSLDEYKTSLNTINKKVGDWIHLQEINSQSYLWLCFVKKMRSGIGVLFRQLGMSPSLASEGIEKHTQH